MASPETRKTVLRQIIERTLKGEWLGFEAYIWAAQRVTGIVIVAFLIVHLYTLGAIGGGEAAFDRIMQKMDSPLVKVGELILLWVLLFHALNGIRLILLNLVPTINHRRIAYWVPVISLILVLVCIPAIV